MIRRILLSALASGTLLGLAGCRHCCRSVGPAPQPYLPTPPGGGSTRTIPPTSVPTSPFAPPPASVLPADVSFPPPNAGVPREGNFRPQPVPVVPKTGPELLFPEPLPPGAPPTVVPLSGQTPEPPRTAPPAPRPEASAELPGFTTIKTGVAAGLKPKSQGFKELKARGYRTAVFLHAPGANTSSEREMAEQAGLTFVPVESSPEKLADALAGVTALVAEKAGHPIYFFADDARGGAVWYLYLRTVDNDSDDTAKLRASRLGLSETDKDFWLAIQTILSKR